MKFTNPNLSINSATEPDAFTNVKITSSQVTTRGGLGIGSGFNSQNTMRLEQGFENDDDSLEERTTKNKESKRVSPRDVAKQLLSLPISFGDYPETGKPMVANIGRFGPYVSHDGKFKSIPKSDNIFEISSDRVIELVAELIEKNKPLRVVGEDSVTKETIEVLKGRWGPYLQRGKIKAPLSQKFDYEKINIDEAMEIVNSKVEREKKSKKKKK